MENVRERLGRIDGKRVVLATPPDFRGVGNALTRKSNQEQGIKYQTSKVCVPFPFKNAAQVRAAGKEVIEGRTLHLAQDFDGAAWDCFASAKDVLEVAASDNNLLALPQGSAADALGLLSLRALQLMFDGHGWSSRGGVCRFLLRTPHTTATRPGLTPEYST